MFVGVAFLPIAFHPPEMLADYVMIYPVLRSCKPIEMQFMTTVYSGTKCSFDRFVFPEFTDKLVEL